jgi:hypothetical protein
VHRLLRFRRDGSGNARKHALVTPWKSKTRSSVSSTKTVRRLTE